MQRICDNNSNGSYENCWSLAIFGDISYLNPGISTIAFYIMNTVEIVSLILLFVALPIVLPVLWRSNTFHLNMMRFIIFFVAQSYVYITSRAVLYIFQIGIVKIANETGNPLDYVVIGATLGRWYQLASMMYIGCAIVIERVCATVYLADYENHKRTRISVILIIAVIVCSCLQSYEITFSVNRVFHRILLVVVIIFIICMGTMCLRIYVYNERRLKKLKNANDKYTLSLKFQLIENMRAFKFMRNSAILTSTGCLIGMTPWIVGIIYLPILNVRAICGQTFEMLNAVLYTGAICGLPLVYHSWRNEVIRRTRILRYFIRERPSKVGLPIQKEMDVYFDDLHSVWNTRLEAKMNTKIKK